MPRVREVTRAHIFGLSLGAATGCGWQPSTRTGSSPCRCTARGPAPTLSSRWSSKPGRSWRKGLAASPTWWSQASSRGASPRQRANARLPAAAVRL